MMRALLVVDVQNEFAPGGQREIAHFAPALEHILGHVRAARRERRPIAWVQHHNQPHESRAFVPGSWGAELSPGLGPVAGAGPERLFVKDVSGAFSATDLEAWLRDLGVTSLLVVGFYAHLCLSTTTREALSLGFDVQVDPEATGARDLEDPVLGRLTADEVRRSALLHLVHMGATVVPRTPRTTFPA
jgi:nicotinamidase-related amidase